MTNMYTNNTKIRCTSCRKKTVIPFLLDISNLDIEQIVLYTMKVEEIKWHVFFRLYQYDEGGGNKFLMSYYCPACKLSRLVNS